MQAVAFVVSFLTLAPVFGVVAPVEPPVLPANVTDAEVLMLLGPAWGVTPTRLPVPVADLERTSLDALVLRLGERGGLPITSADAAAFRDIDPRLAQPLATLIVAMDQAWTLRDEAFASWSDDDIALTLAALDADQPPPRLLEAAEKEALLNAAIMLSDAIESVVIPQLQAAADAGVWPAEAVADPVGVLRIGGTGKDIETLERFINVDARGDDEYYNNAGGATTGRDDLEERRPVSVAIDLQGNDKYRRSLSRPAFGGAVMGIGILYELSGNDDHGGGDVQGSGGIGVGIYRDAAGDDLTVGSGNQLGYGNGGLGYARDDAGDDVRRLFLDAGGFARNAGIGVLWDRAGKDWYDARLGGNWLWGTADGEASGWLVDETSSLDNYTNSATHQPYAHACNDCTWIAGINAEPPGGRGNDNAGGLAYLIAQQDP